MMEINKELKLPCGVILPNRIGKSAMSENMSNVDHGADASFYNAYKRWVDGGAGLCITGNVMIDYLFLGEANNIVIDKNINNHDGLKNWAKASKGTNQQIWVQLNHPGKQSPKFLCQNPVAPSAIAFEAPLNNLFNTPKELSENEIMDIINRFSYSAEIVKKCGFHGVQIHGAHGYLVSQFLSPKHNQRNDRWGGNIENRMRFVCEIYKAIRKKVGNSFPVGIKLNSSDFSKGGFSKEDSILVAKALSELGIDLIEISGGSYESPVMTGKPIKSTTKKREAYFLEFSKEIKDNVSCPLMVTGGFRTGGFMNEALKNKELDLIGLGRPLCLNPDFANELLSGTSSESLVQPLSSGFKILDQLFPLEIIWYTMQIHRLGQNKNPKVNLSVFRAIIKSIFEVGLQSLKKTRS